jgi:hypothetical protein
VDQLVETELEKVESDPKYKKAIADIAALQEPILNSLSGNITATTKGFLPNIAQARIGIHEQARKSSASWNIRDYVG